MRNPGCVLALTLVMAGAVPAMAQVSLICQLNSGIPPVVRSTGVTELISDLVILCTGGSGGQVAANLKVFLNADLTSRLSEPVLLIGEPTSPVPGVNLFQASSVLGNSVTFSNVTFNSPGADRMLAIRITNLRADASGIGALAPGSPNQIVAVVTSVPPGSLPIDNPQQTVGFVLQPVVVDIGLPSTGVPSGVCGGHNQALASSTTATGGTVDLAIGFRELFATAFRTRRAATQQNSPGASFNTESGYFDTTLPSTNGLDRLGLADTGTRLTAKFNNIPAGMKLYVTTAPIEGKASNVSLVSAAGVPVAPTAVATWNGASFAIAPVDDTLTAQWEIIGDDPNSLETYRFGVSVAYTAGTTGGTPTVLGYLGPVAASPAIPRFVTGSSTALTLPFGPCVNGIDLAATALSELPTQGGRTAPTKVSISNNGAVASGPFSIRIQLLDAGNTEHARIESTVPSLGPGEAFTGTYRMRTLLSDVGGSVRGVLTVDTGNAVSDVNRANNTYSTASYSLTCGMATQGNIAATAAGGSYSLPVTSPCQVPAATPYPQSGGAWTETPWLNSAGDKLQVQANPLGFQRTALASASAYGWFQVQQASADPQCSYTLAAGDLSTAPSSGATRTLTIGTGSGCKWSAVSNTRFAAPSGEVMTGPASITLKIRPNFNPASRTIPIAAGNWSGVIMQAGNSRPRQDRIIQMIYFYFLGRLPSDAEIASQVAAMQGMDIEDFMPRFFNALEFDVRSRFVAGLYVGLLARDAEFNGFIYQRDAFLNGIVGQAQLVSNFLNALEWQLRFGSPDNAGFVRLMYNNVLLRAPTQAEVDWQAGNLAGGLSRVQLASNFLNSQEFRIGTGPRLTAFLLYAAVLGRDSVTPEFDSVVARLKAGVSPTDIMAELIGSTEFAGILE